MKTIIIENTTGIGRDTIVRDANTGEKLKGATRAEIIIDKNSFITARVSFIGVQLKVNGNMIENTGQIKDQRKLRDFDVIEKKEEIIDIIEEAKECESCGKAVDYPHCGFAGENAYSDNLCRGWEKISEENRNCIICEYNDSGTCIHTTPFPVSRHTAPCNKWKSLF